MKQESHSIQVNEKTSITSIWLIPTEYRKVLIIAHGAGSGMNAEFICALHEGIAAQNILTIKFNFPYMEQARKAPDRPALLALTWKAVVKSVLEKINCSRNDIVISGKSMGGRYASMLAAEQSGYGGLVLFSYPLHPPGKLTKLRFDHFPSIHCPVLCFQGTRDNLCNLELFQKLITELPKQPNLHIIEGGDHSFNVLKRINRTAESIQSEIIETTTQWIHQLS
jgi:uncharacterized protein